ncbi:hypothetical protein TRIHO_35920 [Tritonibacter horizontis]|uniref:Uncharacterized protein n=1 Tax=Tritonibacter horizontis TaxID=1768241 RepID=A0A132BT58_9RHOB|nr:hypothetical protein TRIHO_35920 [Tritonibacter horizontis]
MRGPRQIKRIAIQIQRGLQRSNVEFHPGLLREALQGDQFGRGRLIVDQSALGIGRLFRPQDRILEVMNKPTIPGFVFQHLKGTGNFLQVSLIDSMRIAEPKKQNCCDQNQAQKKRRQCSLPDHCNRSAGLAAQGGTPRWAEGSGIAWQPDWKFDGAGCATCQNVLGKAAKTTAGRVWVPTER